MTALHIITLLIFAGLGVFAMAIMLESINRVRHFLPFKIPSFEAPRHGAKQAPTCRACH